MCDLSRSYGGTSEVDGLQKRKREKKWKAKKRGKWRHHRATGGWRKFLRWTKSEGRGGGDKGVCRKGQKGTRYQGRMKRRKWVKIKKTKKRKNKERRFVRRQVSDRRHI